MAAPSPSFAHMGLDPRLLQAIAELGWARPTLIQDKAIPLALEGKDLLARARTGSGKTAAYAIPLIQHLLQLKQGPVVQEQAVRALVLVPTKELGRQATTMLRDLAAYCTRHVRIADLSAPTEPAAQRPLLMEKPDVVVGTPGRVLAHVLGHGLSLRDSLELLVLDEADLLLSFGFEDDLKSLLCHLPRIHQSFLMSATFSPDVEALKELVLHNPVTLRLQEARLPGPAQLQQWRLELGTEEDKCLVLYALLKLGLLRGRVLLFAGALERGYRLRLFLEQLGLPTGLLNAQLPTRSRCHILSQFNQGFYDYLIATDELDTVESQAQARTRRKARKGPKADKGQDPEFGVSRGIDFQDVAAVINFDLPPTLEAYVHRAGRTARADNPGMVLTFVLPSERSQLDAIEEALGADNAEAAIQLYQFHMEEIEGLRYRCRDAMRSVTKQAIKEARLRDIKEELLNSEKLKTYFEDNPRDLHLLRHDRPLHPAIIKPHLRHVPDYLVPPSLRAVARPHLSKRKRQRHKPPAHNRAGFQSRGTRNPLRSFRYLGRKPRHPGKKEEETMA
ncbi:PREDICTED: probable ATP-dependent RNA helicase DDX56 [Crocodylus porosus]|uniref:probable ATP-dependent RNA helicase DDX56 n=1 Tax=Crocodylus porosus TaxID=8502 RepID=UPI00093C3CB4|nr:PREDICTED: probable ATP-dependent RNA helicase DDX56 [Crocodylus porosus]